MSACSRECSEAARLRLPRISALVAIIILGVTVAPAEVGVGQKLTTDEPGLELLFSGPTKQFSPWMFWFWDAPLDKQQLLSIAGRIMDSGMNPGYVHARWSLGSFEIGKTWKMDKTPTLDERDWLSDAWFEDFRDVADAAARRGYQLGFVDEFWWPSGNAAGRVVKEHPELIHSAMVPTLTDFETSVAVPPCKFASIARIGAEDTIISSTLRQVSPGTSIEFGPGRWRLYTFAERNGAGGLRGRPGVNYMDRNLPVAFIKEALEPYANNLGARIGPLVTGDFNDNEGTYGGPFAWSQDLKDEFKHRTGRDLEAALPLILDEDDLGLSPVMRCAWFESVAEIYSGYFGALSDWDEKRGLYFISNLWEENLYCQALAAADFMKIQRRVTFPGNDCLHENGLDVTHFKETQSVCELDGKRFMSEVMGALNFGRWQPVAIKKISNAFLAYGVDHVVPHGVFSTRALRNNLWTPDWLDSTPYYGHLPLWSQFIARSCVMNAHGQGQFDTILLNPLPSVWAACGKKYFANPSPAVVDDAWQNFPGDARIIGDRYKELMRTMEASHIAYLIADYYYLDQFRLDAASSPPALVYKNHRFTRVVLPSLRVLSRSNLEKLAAFAEAGGTVVATGSLPTGSMEAGREDKEFHALLGRMKGCPSFSTIPAAVGGKPLADELKNRIAPFLTHTGEPFDLLSQHRMIAGSDYMFLANNSGVPQSFDVTFRGVGGRGAEIWDPETGKTKQVETSADGKGLKVSMSLSEYQAVWVKALNHPSAPPQDSEAVGWDKQSTPPGPWTLRFSPDVQPQIELPNPIPENWQQGQPVPALKSWHELGMREFSGFGDYLAEIEVPPGRDMLRVDLGDVRFVSEILLDGVSAGKRFWPPHIYEIPVGEKRALHMTVRIGNSAANVYAHPIPAGLIGPVKMTFGRTLSGGR